MKFKEFIPQTVLEDINLSPCLRETVDIYLWGGVVKVNQRILIQDIRVCVRGRRTMRQPPVEVQQILRIF